MKRIYFIAALLSCAVGGAFAQKQTEPLPYDKEKLDSLFGTLPKLNQPFALPVPKGYSFPDNLPAEKQGNFETKNPGATIINKTNRGAVYNMPLDNMAVLVPDMNTVENMPGSNKKYRTAPVDKMPNPLAPKTRPKK